MTGEWKKTLLTYLDSEIGKATLAATKADAASRFIVTGHSQAGDKYHAEGAAELTKQYVSRLNELKTEIQKSPEEILTTAVPVSHIEIEYDDRSRLDFTFANQAISLTKYLFISKNSPIGKAILGKNEGESFSYALSEDGNSKSFSGKILKIE